MVYQKEKIIKVALIGCGKMGIHHLKAIQKLNGIKIIALADSRIDEQNVRDIIGKDAEFFSTAQELFEKTNPDAVHIVTPPNTHYKIGKLALESGAHAFIEKPFVEEVWQARELFQIAQIHGLKLFAGHQLLAQKMMRRAEYLINNIGNIVHIESYFSFRKTKKSLSVTEQAIDILPHPTYTLLHFLKDKNKSENNYDIEAIETDVDGEIRAILKNGKCKGLLIISLKGRPVDSYLKIVGTNGSVFIDYVRGVVVNLSGAGADAVSAIITPYRQAWQHAWQSTKAFARMALKNNKSYDGLADLIENFYGSILNREKPLATSESIIETVKICELIAADLNEKDQVSEKTLKIKLKKDNKRYQNFRTTERIIVTGGNGFLGSAICKELRDTGWPVRVLSRNMPRFSERMPGIEYEAVDLAGRIPTQVLEGASAVIHCAAETAGGLEDHKRNSVEATINIFEKSADVGIKKFIHMSSIAVLKPNRNRGTMLNEDSTVDLVNHSRGPYVWGKAQSEERVSNLSKSLGLEAKIIRLGPLIDYHNFQAPGRLGREAGSYFIVMGSKKSRLFICELQTVAKVVAYYLKNYDHAPPVLHLIEPNGLTRKELIARLCEYRQDLRPLYVPSLAVNGLSSALYGMQKMISPSRAPVNIAAAFSSEKYCTDLAAKIITKASL